MELAKELYTLKERVDAELEKLFSGDAPYKRLNEAMRYSLLAGGKRIRPILTLKFSAALGGDMGHAMPLALAVEMIHTYSLIHDDLPCMDNDDLRRGKPTNHVVFGEGRAAVAGDALQAAAFELALSAPLPAERVVKAVKYLANAAGPDGMCGGQELDTAEDSDRSLEGLTCINDLKTGAMLRAACVLGVIAAGGTDGELAAAEKYGLHLARAFQIRDDILDIVSTPEELGKPIGSDRENDKPTYASVLGVDEAEKRVLEETELAKAAIENVLPDPAFFLALADLLAVRGK